MALHPQFPTSPYAPLIPEQRWFPAAEELRSTAYEKLLPPLVAQVRQEVFAWRNKGYAGASATSVALLRHWFETEHLNENADGSLSTFRYYFAQREAVETVIWLYEVRGARDKYDLLRFDASGAVSSGMFPEDWPRYVLKMATGAGKTKVLSLLIAWSFFHKLYETDSALARNFLVIAPNIIVLVRFHDVAYIEVTPRFGNVAQTSKSAVSQVSQPAVAAQSGSAAKSPRPADLGIGDTAGLETCATKAALTVAVELTDFSVYYSQGVVDAITADLKAGKSEVVCEAGKLVKISKDKHGVITRDVLTKKWTDWVDYWAVDFDYESRKEIIKVPKRMGVEGELPGAVQADAGEFVDFEERWTGAYIFENEWQSFRTRQSRDLELTSVAHTYAKPGRYTIAVKVIDIFGNDTMTLMPVTVG